jgi:siderophore synthetase component
MTPEKRIAEEATAEVFLNCYLREAAEARFLPAEAVEEPELRTTLAARDAPWLARVALPPLGLELLAPVRYRSRTWRHRFGFPLYGRALGGGPLIPLDYVTLAALAAKEVHARDARTVGCPYDELIGRVIDSCKNIERFVRARRGDFERARSEPLSFIDAEQSAVLGHAMHPTPKSRQGMNDEEIALYSPELRARFALHYFLADRAIMREDSVLPAGASRLVAQQLAREVSPEFRAEFCDRADAALLPVHPWQAGVLRRDPAVQALLADGRLRDLGPAGEEYWPTMSVRTVYRPGTAFMYKLSLGVKVTNSVRLNLEKELERGLEIQRLLRGPIGAELARRFPGFRIVGDPAYLTLAVDGRVLPGFSTVLRENPFAARAQADATPVAALCQDDPYGEPSRIARLVARQASRTRRSSEDVAREWLRRYADLLLRPLLWLYFTHGVGLEAHQQNTVVELEDGYPARVYYRDNQGYYYRRTRHGHLNGILPGISEKSQTVCDDAVVDERLLYYVFVNNLYGLVNALGIAGLADEDVLLADLRGQIERVGAQSGEPTPMLDRLLRGATLRCKSNLLTRFHDMDELAGAVDTQSVYVSVANPLAAKEVSCAAA